MYVLKFTKQLGRDHFMLLAGNIMVLIFVSVVGVASMFTAAPVIDLILHPELEDVSGLTKEILSLVESAGLESSLVSVLMVFLAFQVLRSGLLILAWYSTLRIKYAVDRDLTLGSYEDFFNARWSFFSGAKQGELLNTFTREISVTGNALSSMGTFFSSLIQLVFYVAVPLYLSWQITAGALVVAGFFALPFLLLGKVNYRLGRLNTSTSNLVTSVIHESLSGAKVILGFGNQHSSMRLLGKAYDDHVKVTLKSQILRLGTPLLYEPLGLIVVVSVLFIAKQQGMALSEIAVLLWAMRNATPLVGSVLAERNSLANFFPSYEQINRLRERAQNEVQESGGKPFLGLGSGIVVEGLSFGYPGGVRALCGVDLVVPTKSMVALVGESGSGKSTLVDLLMGFHTPDQGEIRVDGQPLKDFDVTSYRRKLGYVPQESVLFNTTIKENMLWAKEDATQDEVERACHQANASEFILELSEGYDTVVGDRGVRLSGGQRQRIALARAILRQPDLLILDEATSALDSISEGLIQEALESISKSITVVIIAHRLSTIVQADEVCVLHGGCVVERGTYGDLSSRGGRLSEMKELQAL